MDNENVNPVPSANPIQGRKTCGAKTKSGKPCGQLAMENGRCKLHGGLTPVGVASTNFKHGRYSKHLPKHLADDYERALTDPDLLNLNDEIALTTMRINDLLSKYIVGDDSVSWSQIEEAQDLRRRLCSTQSRHLLDTNQTITAARLYLLVSAIQDIILRNVEDGHARAAIAHELRQILVKQLPDKENEENE